MDHMNERKKSADEWEIFQKNVVEPIVALYGNTVEEEEIQRMVGILNINSVSFTFPRERLDGRALYPALSLISHSCVANTRYQGMYSV